MKYQPVFSQAEKLNFLIYPDFVRIYGEHASADTVFTYINEVIALYERSPR